MSRALQAEEVEQQLARRSGDNGGRFTPPGPDGLSGPRPLKLKTCAAQPPARDTKGARLTLRHKASSMTGSFVRDHGR